MARRSARIKAIQNAKTDGPETFRRNKRTRTTKPQYEHAPLDLNTDQFRLIRFTRQSSGPMTGILEVHNRHEAPSYTALSYVWGPPDDAHDILIDGLPLKIRANLYAYLDMYARPHNPPLGAEKEVDYLWIDQTCINQNSIAERNQQVAQMSSIYKEAMCVDAWLGPDDDETAQAIEYMLKASQEFPDLPDRLDDDEDARRLTAAQEARIREHTKRYKNEIHFAEQLLRRPYWTRLWILQEFVLARKLRLICGNHMLSFEDLSAGYTLWYWFADIVDGNILMEAFLHCGLRIRGTDENAAYFQLSSICLCNMLNCSEPRDHIYGLLGLCCDLERRMEVDYSKSTQQIFYEAIAFLQDTIDEELLKLCEQAFYDLGDKMGVQKEVLTEFIDDHQQRSRSEHS